MKFVFFRFWRREKIDSVMKGQMGAMPPRIFGLEPPLDAAAVLFGLNFVDNIHYKLKSNQARLSCTCIYELGWLP